MRTADAKGFDSGALSVIFLAGLAMLVRAMVTAGTGHLRRCVRHGQGIPGRDRSPVRLRSSAGTVNLVAGVEDAAVLAETWLAGALPRRWRHVQSVARRAAWAADRLSLPDQLVTAAWLHDIGYAPGLAVTGFHPLDGARFLRRAGAGGRW